MDFKDQIIKSIEKEIKIIKHLFTKLPENSNDFRPAEGMRSLNELLDYLTWCGAGAITAYLNTESDYRSITQEYREKARQFSLAQFPEAMDEQMQIIRELLGSINDEDLKNKEVTVVWGEKMKLGEAILNTTFKYFVAYRMQLFLYAKMAGASQLTTANNWVGMDPVK